MLKKYGPQMVSFSAKKKFKIKPLSISTEKTRAKFLKLIYTSYFANKFSTFRFFSKPQTIF
jgi:hypothetical protein